MPSHLKKLVRARMAETGEPHQEALRHVRAQAAQAATTTRGNAAAPADEADALSPFDESLLVLLHEEQRRLVPADHQVKVTVLARLAEAREQECSGRLRKLDRMGLLKFFDAGGGASLLSGARLTDQGEEEVCRLYVPEAKGRVAEFADGLADVQRSVLDIVVEQELGRGEHVIEASEIRARLRKLLPEMDVATATGLIEALSPVHLLAGRGVGPAYQVTLHGLLASLWGSNALHMVDQTLDVLRPLHSKNPSIRDYSWRAIRKTTGLPPKASNLAYVAIKLAKLGPHFARDTWTMPLEPDIVLARANALEHVRHCLSAALVAAPNIPSAKNEPAGESFCERLFAHLRLKADKLGEVTSDTDTIAEELADGSTGFEVHQALLHLNEDGAFRQLLAHGDGMFHLTIRPKWISPTSGLSAAGTHIGPVVNNVIQAHVGDFYETRVLAADVAVGNGSKASVGRRHGVLTSPTNSEKELQMTEQQQYTRYDVAVLMQSGAEILDKARIGLSLSPISRLRSWLGQLDRLLRDDIDVGTRLKLEEAMLNIDSLRRDGGSTTQPVLVGSLSQILHTLAAIRRSHRFRPTEIGDDDFTRFLRAAKFVDGQLGLGETVDVARVATRAKLDASTALRAVGRMVDESLGYDVGDEVGQIQIDHDAVDFALDELAAGRHVARDGAAASQASGNIFIGGVHHMGTTIKTTVTDSVVGAIAAGEGALAQGTVSSGGTTQADYLATIKAAQIALVHDQDALSATVYDGLGQLLRLLREVQVDSAKAKETIDEIWAKLAARELRSSNLPTTLEVVKALAASPLTATLAKHLIGGA